MNKNVIVATSLLLVVALASGGFFLLKNKSNSTNSGSQQNTGNTPTDSKKSLKDLLDTGLAQECTFNDIESKVSGKVYIANKKMRSDYEMTTDKITIKSHTIIDGNTAYIWMDDQQSGFKMNIDQTSQANLDAENTESVDINKKADYKCSVWIVNNETFSLPNITFQDLSEITKISPMVTNPNTTADQCDTCNQLPAGDIQNQCKEALGCN